MDILLNDFINQLSDIKNMRDTIEKELYRIIERKEIHILSSSYSNGIYMQFFNLGFEETIDFLKSLLKKYNQEIESIEDKIHVLHELLGY